MMQQAEQGEEWHQDPTAGIYNRQEKKPTISIRVSARTQPIMIVGQEESVFAQYLLVSKTWVGPKGQRPLLPKSEGDGFMLFAFISLEFDFGRDLSDNKLAKMNHEQRIGKTYIDTQAALEVLKTTQKLFVDRITVCAILVHWDKQRRLLEQFSYECAVGGCC